MSSLPSISIYGRDGRLLQTRRWVLENAGFTVSIALSLDEATKEIDARRFDLFILCHTLSVADCTGILTAIHTYHPELKTLLLSTARSGCECEKDFVMGGFASPQNLTSTVCELLNPAPVAA